MPLGAFFPQLEKERHTIIYCSVPCSYTEFIFFHNSKSVDT